MPDEKDMLGNMPQSVKPVNLGENKTQQAKLKEKLELMPGRKKSWGKMVIWIIVLIIVILGIVQYVNAAKYQALVQVINEDKIGVNPTGERLDFGDLPRDKSALRSVILSSQGNTGSYVIIWKFGNISDLIKISRNYFTLKAHTTEKVDFTVNIPNSAEFKYYKGRVVIFQIPKIW